MRPILETPGTERLTLTYDKLLSSFAFCCTLRRYIEAWPARLYSVPGRAFHTLIP
jgi:hypothetical protein